MRSSISLSFLSVGLRRKTVYSDVLLMGQLFKLSLSTKQGCVQTGILCFRSRIVCHFRFY